MEDAPYTVCIVVDRGFGDRLAQIEAGVPVWIVGTPVNKPVIQRLWKERSTETHLTGITIFDDANTASTEDLLLDKIDAVDLHHGPYSASPPYTAIEVFGTPLTSTIKNELSDYGFNEFYETADGFRAIRPVDAARSHLR